MELDDVVGVQVNWLEPNQAHGDSMRQVVGIQFFVYWSLLGLELQLTQVKRMMEVLVGEGIIKLGDIKIQYHKKMKQYTVLFLQVFVIADVVH